MPQIPGWPRADLLRTDWKIAWRHRDTDEIVAVVERGDRYDIMMYDVGLVRSNRLDWAKRVDAAKDRARAWLKQNPQPT